MDDISQLRLVLNRDGSISLIYEDRAYKLNHTGKQKKYWRCSKKKRSGEKTKPIPAIYDDKAFVLSSEPSTSDSSWILCGIRELPEQILDHFKTTKFGEDFLLWQSESKHILVFATGSNIRLLAASSMDGTFKVVPEWYQQLFTIHVFTADTAFLPVPQVHTGISLLAAGTTEPITTWKVGINLLNRKPGKGHNGFYELLQLLIAEQGVMDTLIQQVL
ncbi:hypothetical protein T11_1239 [Trichinella zimbabwensis]|uniref:FLYWCH-type domain-containing protein n=1 Tax=Trichinella zimbabwensis TaxID=268475 RepID=A0A0V1HSV4_9BILA|nr:hypothetical protein T11_1239 [Trichinella zimbabwensis]